MTNYNDSINQLYEQTIMLIQDVFQDTAKVVNGEMNSLIILGITKKKKRKVDIMKRTKT